MTRRPRESDDSADAVMLRQLAHAPRDLAHHVQRDKIDTFMMVTQCFSEARARACLASAQGDVERAISIYFDTQHQFAGAHDEVIVVDDDEPELYEAHRPHAHPAPAAAAAARPPLPVAAHVHQQAALVRADSPPPRHPRQVAPPPQAAPFVGQIPPQRVVVPQQAQNAPQRVVNQQAQPQPAPHAPDVEADLRWVLLQERLSFPCLKDLCDDFWRNVKNPIHCTTSLLGAYLFMRCNRIRQDCVLSPRIFNAVIDLRNKRREIVAVGDQVQLKETCPPRCDCQCELHQIIFDICNSQTYALRCRIMELFPQQLEVMVSISSKADNSGSGTRNKVCCSNEEKQSVMSLINLLCMRNGVPAPDFSLGIRPVETVAATHEKLALTLRPYQQESVSQMLHVERHGYTSFSSTKVREGLFVNYSVRKGAFSVSDHDRTASTRSRDGVLADEMGLGKTLCCIATAIHNPPTVHNTPSAAMLRGQTFIPGTLILATVSLVGQWEQEILKSVPQAKLCRFYGPERHKITAAQLAEFDFIVSTTHTGTADLQSTDYLYRTTRRRLLSQCYFHRIIVDEFHLCPNYRISESVSFAWCVSGTPCMYQLSTMVQHRPGAEGCSQPEQWACFDYNRDPRRPVLVGSAVAGTYKRTVYERPMPLALICHKKSELPPEQIALPPRHFVTRLFDLNHNESIIYMHTIAPLVKNLREMTRGAIIENHGKIRQWLTVLRELVVDASQDDILGQVNNGIVEFNVERANDRAEVQKITPREVRELFNKARSVYSMNDALEAILKGLEGRPPDPGQCTLCLDLMRAPTMLRCTHVFCYECLMDAINTNVGGAGLCPMCRAQTMTQQKYLLQVPAPADGDDDDDDDDDGNDGGAAAQSVREFGIAAPTAAAVAAARTAIAHDVPARVRAVLDVIREVDAAAGNVQRRPKFVIFSSMRNILAKIEHALNRSQMKCIVIDGSVSMVKRAEATKAFQDVSSQVNICLLSSRAAAAGLTLTAANHMILVEPATNNDLENQAMGRIHRIGQDREVTIHRLAARGTIDERTYALLDAGDITSTGLERFGRVENRAEVCKLMLRILVGDAFAAQTIPQ